MIAKRLQDFQQSDAIRRRLVDWAPVGTLVLLCILLASGSRRFLTADNFINIFEQSTTVLIMGIGQTFVILMGGIDLSVAALASLASVLTALLVPIVGIWTFPIILLFGLVAGYLVGLVHGRLRIPSFIATLGALGVWTGLAFTISNATPIAISPADGAAVDWVRGDSFGLPNEIWIVVVTLIVAVVIERLTRFGRFVYAIGAGEEAARLSGVPVIRYKIMAFALCGMFSAFSGFVLAARLSGGSARLADAFLLKAIAVVILGGTAISGGYGGVLRTLVGVLIVIVLETGMNQVGIDPWFQQAVYGAAVILAVTLTMDRSQVKIIK